MKRSEVNAALKKMERLIQMNGFHLPPFCSFTPEEWASKDHSYDEIRDTMLGWDITDFGLNQFERIGFSLITLRNGSAKNDRYQKPYAEKLLLLEETQSAPMHFHRFKMEDIINRGGGDVLIRVYGSNDGVLSDADIVVHCDGRAQTVKAGTQICLHPGESITIPQFLYHDFHGVAGTGSVLLGEVSMCNDDLTDNRFYEQIGRFPTIEEDELPYRLLCNEYPPAP